MRTRVLITTLTLSLALVSVAPAAVQPPPKATGWKSTLTASVSGPPATIQITKASKVGVKPSANNVTFSLKLSGVTNTADDTAANTVMNTLQVDVQVLNTFQTLNFTFDLLNGKNVEKKFTMTNASLPTAPAAGAAVEVLGARVIQGGTGRTFGVSGITLK